MNHNAPSKGSASPWGPIQTVHTAAAGIVSVSTASHGGFWLSPVRCEELLRRFPGFEQRYSELPWLEEDCDACLVPLVWPDEFPVTFLRGACFTFGPKGTYQPAVRQWLNGTPDGQALIARVRAWERDNAALWEQGGLSSCPRGWDCFFTRVGDRAQRREILAEYPDQQFYTDAELDQISLGQDRGERPKARRLEVDFGGVFDGERVWSETELGGAPGF